MRCFELTIFYDLFLVFSPTVDHVFTLSHCHIEPDAYHREIYLVFPKWQYLSYGLSAMYPWTCMDDTTMIPT